MTLYGSSNLTYGFLLTSMRKKRRYRDQLYICNNTWARYNEDTKNIVIYHWGSGIITYTPDDKIILRLGGWYDSVTSRQRINRFTPVYVFSNHRRLELWAHHGHEVYDFFNGITLDLNGNVLNSPQSDSEVGRRWRMRELRKRAKALAVFILSVGDTNHTLIHRDKVEVVDFLPPRGRRVYASFGYTLSTYNSPPTLWERYNSDRRVEKFMAMVEPFIQPGGKLYNEWIEYNLTPDDEKEFSNG